MERSIQKNGLINLLALLAVGVGGFAVARFANSLAGQVAVVFMALGILVAAVSWFQMRLEDRERLEKLELEELARTHGGAAHKYRMVCQHAREIGRSANALQMSWQAPRGEPKARVSPAGGRYRRPGLPS